MSRDDSSGGMMAITSGLGVAAVAMFVSLAVVTRVIGPAAIPIWGMTVGGAAWVLRGPLGKALSRRLGGEDPGAIPPELPAEILGELDDLRHRVLELEERVDFSERLLASKGQSFSGGTPGA